MFSHFGDLRVHCAQLAQLLYMLEEEIEANDNPKQE